MKTAKMIHPHARTEADADRGAESRHTAREGGDGAGFEAAPLAEDDWFEAVAAPHLDSEAPARHNVIDKVLAEVEKSINRLRQLRGEYPEPNCPPIGVVFSQP